MQHLTLRTHHGCYRLQDAHDAHSAVVSLRHARWPSGVASSSPSRRMMCAQTAILNGFGRVLGDSIIGLQALTLAIQSGTVPHDPVLFRLPGLSAVIQQTYASARALATVRTLEWKDEKPGPAPPSAAGFARIIDLRDFAFDPQFRGVAMIDFFLSRLGVTPESIPSARKRNTWLRSCLSTVPPVFAPGYVLICPISSAALRCMPVPIHEAIVQWVRTNTSRRVLTQATLRRRQTLAQLCGLVAGASLIVSTDTAMVHLADAFSIPCLAFLTTHRPEWRVRDYPLCRPVYLPVAGVPPALEFSRGESDQAAVHAAWFPAGDDLRWLDVALHEATVAAGIRVRECNSYSNTGSSARGGTTRDVAPSAQAND